MEIDHNAKKAVREMSEAINEAIEQSQTVANIIRYLREIGYEPNLTLKLEVSLQEIEDDFDDLSDEVELELTDDDLRTLRRMKIRFE